MVMLALAAMLAVSSWLTFTSSAEQRRAEYWESHTRTVLEHTATLRIAVMSTMRGERGYLLTHDPEFLKPYIEGRNQIAGVTDSLKQEFANSPQKLARLAMLEEKIDLHLGKMAQLIALVARGQHEEAVRRTRAGEDRSTIEGIFTPLSAFESEEVKLLEERVQIADIASERSASFERLLGMVGVLLLIIGALASIALRRSLAREARVSAELRRIATTDELTGLANRRELLGSLDRMMGGARRNKRPLSVAILDIDRFKLVNDTYGHPAGDEVIRRVGQMAVEVMRDQDLVGRLGGEEFVIAFPECRAAEAVAACERLRAAIAALHIILPDGSVMGITVSSGVAQLIEGDDRNHLIARADEALYIAKQNGRDQVRLAA
ncbi:hypothetical protein GCM10009127_21720 [Alteraurantiacibacter aestuarii]